MGTRRAGQRDEFGDFVEGHFDEVVRALTLATGDRDRAQDAAQEAFARAFRKWSTVSQMERPVGWVIVVGINQQRRWFARGERRAALIASTSDRDTVGRDPITDLAEHAPLRQAIEQLRPRQRATVVLRYLCDLSTEQVAEALGCSTGTVKSSLHSALTNLRVELDGVDEADAELSRGAPAMGAHLLPQDEEVETHEA